MPEEVKIIIRAIDQATEAFSKVSKAANDLGKRVSSISKQIASAGAVFTGFAAPAIAGLGMAIKKGAEFEQAMRNVQSITGSTEEQFKELSRFAKEMGEKTVFSATEAANAMYYLASAGYNSEQIMSSLKGILDLAAATQSDLAYTSEIVVSTLNAFNMGAEESSRVANVFAAAISNSQLTMERLGVSMPYISSVANTLGISLEETVATLGVLVSAGIRAESAGRLLATSLQRLLDPSNEAVEALEKYGLTLDDISPKSHSIAEIIETLKQAHMDTADVVKIFGAESSRVWLTLLEVGGAAVDQLREKITGTNAATEMAATQLNSVQSAIKLIKSAIESLEISIFDQLRDDIKRAAEEFRKAIPTISAFVKEFVTNLIPVARQVGGVLLSLMEKFNSLSESNKALIAKISALAIGFAAVVGPLMMFIGAIGTGIGTLISFGGAITGLASTVVAALGGMVARLGMLIASVAPTIGGMLTAFAGPIGAVIAAAGLLYLAWKKNFLGIKDFTHKILEYIKVLFEVFGVKFKNTWKIIMYTIHVIVVKAINGLLSRIESGLNKVIDAVNSLIDKINSKLGRFGIHISKISRISIPKLALPKAPELEKAPELPKLGLPGLKDIFKLPSLKGFESEYLDRFMREAKEEAKKAEEAAKKAKESADKMKEQLKMPEIPSMPELPKLPELKRAAAPRVIHVDKVETNIHVEKIDESNIDHIADLISDAFLKKLTARTGYYP